MRPDGNGWDLQHCRVVWVVYVGDDEMRQGRVAIMMSARAKRGNGWMPISKRIIKARFYSKYKKQAVKQTYAPTKDAIDEETEEFYIQLQGIVSSCNRYDMIVVIGGLDAKIGNNNSNRE